MQYQNLVQRPTNIETNCINIAPSKISNPIVLALDLYLSDWLLIFNIFVLYIFFFISDTKKDDAPSL